MNEERKINEKTQVGINLILKILILAAATFIVGLILLLSGLNFWFNYFFYDNSTLIAIFRLITELGDTRAYIFLIVIVWYVYDKKIAKNLAFGVLGSYFINTIIKDAFQDPRPPTNDRGYADGYGFPSGHAQQSVAAWGYLAYESYIRKNKILFWIFTVLVYVIASSRIIIGVHDVQDIWGGLTFGFIWLILFILIEPKVSEKVSDLSIIIKVILAVVIPIVLFLIGIFVFLVPTGDYGLISGAMMGLSLGYIFETEKIKYEPRELSTMQKILNLVIGIVIALVLYLGLSLIFPESQIMDLLQYFILSFVLVGFVPWIFVKINRKS